MKKSVIPVVFTFFIIFSYFGIMPIIAEADDNTCVMEAKVDVIVEVWDLDNLGNKGQRIFKGLLKQGEKKQIQSMAGQIRYARTVNVKQNEPLSGDIGRPCFNGKIISVP